MKDRTMDNGVFQRSTQQRRVILEELKRLSSHPTAAELHKITQKRLPRISLGTVYRNLDLLARKGMIRKLETGRGEARFDGDLDHHYHVRCVSCGRVDDAHDLAPDSVTGEVESLNGYKVLGFHLEFFGVCPACGDQEPPNAQDGR